MYYAIGHFSAYIPPNSKGLHMRPTKSVEAVSMLRPDGSVVIIILNDEYNMNSNWAKWRVKDVRVKVTVPFATGRVVNYVTVRRHSINTLIIPPPPPAAVNIVV